MSDEFLTSSEYGRILGVIKKELRKQIVATNRVIKLRLFLYYQEAYGKIILGNIDLLWMKLQDAINRAIEEKQIQVYKPSKPAWFTLPEFTEGEKKKAFQDKKIVFEKWIKLSSSVGFWFEGIVRDAFRKEGYTVNDSKVKFQWNGQEIEVDVYTIHPFHLAIEVKNKFSDVIYAPTMITERNLNEDHKQIKNFFKFCYSRDITPILIAPLVDKSFQGFQAEYKGLFCRTYFQFFRKKYEQLCKDVKEKLRIGHIKAIDEPPESLRRWIRSIPNYLSRYNV